ncbi:40-kDa huntingtin-associated protein-like isoform X2 [Oscarella lobularis]|uniref:40-kDa huntingtin-associated protein-like isoform X2 n=1 Tax=Oscarella lobularis TaxID=121494 RepID=UPI00331368F3
MNPSDDYLSSFRDIHSKLKKRFFRKTNATQAAKELASLGRRLSDQGAPAYSAFFHQAAAKTESSAGNHFQEIDSTLESARQYLHAVREARYLGVLSFDENFVNAQVSYRRAAALYTAREQPLLAGAVMIELGDVVANELDRYDEAVPFYVEAIDAMRDAGVTEKIDAQGKLAWCQILAGDFEGALDVLVEIVALCKEFASSADGSPAFYGDTMRRCDILVILLLILLRPLNFKTNSKFQPIVRKYFDWDPLSTLIPVDYMPMNLFLVVHSILIAGEADDLRALKDLQRELWPLASPEQNHVMHELIGGRQ